MENGSASSESDTESSPRVDHGRIGWMDTAVPRRASVVLAYPFDALIASAVGVSSFRGTH